MNAIAKNLTIQEAIKANETQAMLGKEGEVNGLDLFSGIGGLSLALKPWAQTVAYCERDRYAQSVLLSRMASSELDRAPIWDDITSLKASMLPSIDIIFGGFPCQDISVAGLGRGLGGERSGLYTHIERLVGETKPTFVFLENVPAIRTRGLGRVVWGLASLGYDLRWTVVSAASVGAPHKRDRWFLLAANTAGIRGRSGTGESCGPWSANDSLRVDWWATEPAVARVANGISNRVDRVRCLGNAVVPAQARKAFEILTGNGELK